ncbi:MAG: hypothetical protein II434_07540, partial [Bacteroidales bacterium]|nr:hypothetical protein [Bacteroidales bacterium]
MARYYIIAGEASGDLHGSNLMRGIFQEDPSAQVRFWGGGLMDAVYRDHQVPGGGFVRDYKDGAVMGFKYFDFGNHSGSEMKCVIKLDNCYMSGKIHIFADGVPMDAVKEYARPIF